MTYTITWMNYAPVRVKAYGIVWCCIEDLGDGSFVAHDAFVEADKDCLTALEEEGLLSIADVCFAIEQKFNINLRTAALSLLGKLILESSKN